MFFAHRAGTGRLFFPWPFGGGFFIFTCFFTAMFFRDFSFSLVFCRDLRGAKAASKPPASSPFYGENHAISGPRTPPKNKWKNDGMTGKNKCPKPPKKQVPALLVKLRRSAGTPCRGRTQPAKSSKAVPPRLTLFPPQSALRCCKAAQGRHSLVRNGVMQNRPDT